MTRLEMGMAFYVSVDLPESGLHTVFVQIKREARGLYRVYWRRELDHDKPLSGKDELAMVTLIFDRASQRLRSRFAPEGDIYIK